MRVLWVRRILQICFLITFIFVGAIGLVGLIYDCKNPAPIEDIYPPVAKIKDGEKISIAVGEKYEDAGIDAYDINGDITISTEGEVDSNKVGEYEIKYRVTDEANNATEVTRIVRVIEPTGIVYLTFDDGPGEYTSELLDILNKYGVKVTFFVTGRGDDSLIKREYEEGHTVALHTYTHNYSYVYSSTENYFDDLYDIQNLVKEQTGQTAKLIRFPGGSSNLVSRRYDGKSRIMSTLVDEVEDKGFIYFDWNVDSNDAGGAKSSEEVYDNVTSRLKRGGESVVLQHDIKGFSVDAVEDIIKYCLDEGFVLKPLTEDSYTAHHDVNN